MTLDPSDLRLRIDEAFGGMPYPGDEQIVTHNRGDCSECERTQNALKGRHWRDLSIDRERIDEQIAAFYGSGEGEHWFFERVSGFNEAQSKVIRQFLEYMRDAHSEDESEDAERAIERYWHLF